ncbi:cytochrome c3 family protein, partial [Salmonella enterica]|uniref:cytochrome c3 family protein n=1 Tax=Salmonella enterica TaxID=28901 RepID=UPI0035268EDD
ANDNTGCADCHTATKNIVRSSFANMSTHISTYGGKQDTNFLCRACHDPHGSTNLKMIRTDIYKYTTWAKNSTNWVVTFTNRTSTSGINGFVNTKTNRGLCQICHTKTKYWKSGKVETVHYTA